MQNESIEEMNKLLQQSLKETKLRKELEDTPEIQELRRLRDEAYKKSQEYQDLINKKIMEIHKTPDIVNKYTKTIIRNSVHNNIHFGLVSKVERLFKGIKITYSKAFDITEFEDSKDKIVTLASGEVCYENTIYWEDLNRIEIITEEEYLDNLRKNLEYFK